MISRRELLAAGAAFVTIPAFARQHDVDVQMDYQPFESRFNAEKWAGTASTYMLDLLRPDATYRRHPKFVRQQESIEIGDHYVWFEHYYTAMKLTEDMLSMSDEYFAKLFIYPACCTTANEINALVPNTKQILTAYMHETDCAKSLHSNITYAEAWHDLQCFRTSSYILKRDGDDIAVLSWMVAYDWIRHDMPVV